MKAGSGNYEYTCGINDNLSCVHLPIYVADLLLSAIWKFIIIIIITSIDARLWRASLLWRVVDGISAKVL